MNRVKEGTASNSFWPLSLSYALRGLLQQNIWVSHKPNVTVVVIHILRSVLIIIRYARKYFKELLFSLVASVLSRGAFVTNDTDCTNLS